jgi:hypothetical protein
LRPSQTTPAKIVKQLGSASLTIAGRYDDQINPGAAFAIMNAAERDTPRFRAQRRSPVESRIQELKNSVPLCVSVVKKLGQ